MSGEDVCHKPIETEHDGSFAHRECAKGERQRFR